MYPRNGWYVAALSEELGDAPLGRVLLDQPMVLFRAPDGTAVALVDKCAHRGAPLSHGVLAHGGVQCPYHGFVFGPDGTCRRIPGLDQVPRGARVAAWPVAERDGLVWVWPGAAAPLGLIPDLSVNVAPGWASVGAVMDCAAEYRLMIDNLLDLSHVAFVHGATIGSDDSNARITLEREAGTVRLTRAATDIPTPPHNIAQGFGPRCDQTKIITYLPPSCVTIEITTTERGRAPPRSMHLMILNMMTPKDATNCHYFWRAARDFATDDAAVSAFLRRTITTAFAEDLAILALQQENLTRGAPTPMVAVPADAGLIAARRLLDGLIAREEPVPEASW